jgi:hypothetical protein
MNFPQIDDHFISLFPKGSWEFAAMSVYFDAHYQLGLFYLTYAMDIEEKAKTYELILHVFDRLFAASKLLQKTWYSVKQYQTFSSSLQDLQKNTALSFLRLQAYMNILQHLQEKLITFFQQQQQQQSHSSIYLVPNDLQQVLFNKDFQKDILQNATEHIHEFIHMNPQDRDVSIFAKSYQKLQEKLKEL